MRAHAAPFTDLWSTASMNFRLTPIPLRRTETRILPALSQLLRQYPRGLVGATHRHLPRPRVTRMQTRVAIGGTTNAPAGHTDTCHICCNEMFSCNEIRAAASNPVGSTMKRTRDFNRSATSPTTRAPVARPGQSRNGSCVITLKLPTKPTKPANARASLAIRGQADPERIRR
jgi:hypothetical protein